MGPSDTTASLLKNWKSASTIELYAWNTASDDMVPLSAAARISPSEFSFADKTVRFWRVDWLSESPAAATPAWKPVRAALVIGRCLSTGAADDRRPVLSQM